MHLNKQLVYNIFLMFLTSFIDHISSSTEQKNMNNDDYITTTVIPTMTSSTLMSSLATEKTLQMFPKLIVHMINSSNYSSHKNKIELLRHNHANKNRSIISEPYIFINGRSIAASNFTSFSHVMIDINSSSTNNNQYNNCIDGKTFWNYRTGQCQQCMPQCPTGAMVSRPCNRTHNLECICTKGSYMSIVDGTCKPCSECPSGYGVWRTCRWSRNTVCRQCQPGTYSGVAVGTLGCIPCSKCGPNQEMISGCDGNRDTVCIDRSALVDSYLTSIDDGQQQMYFNGPSSSLSLSPGNFDRITHSNGYGLPFYIAMLVAIVFSFCLYALIQLRCNNSLIMHHRVTSSMPHHHAKLLPANTNVNLRSMANTTCSHYPYNVPTWVPTSPDILPYQSSSPSIHFDHTIIPMFQTTNNNKRYKSSRKSHRSASKYNNRIYYELLLGPNIQTNESTMIQSVPLISDDVQHLTIEIRQALENLLGKDSESWRLLARELGYDEQHIVQFEAKATTMSNGRIMVDTFKSIRLLLLDWSSQMTTSPDESSKTSLKQDNCGPPSLATLTNALIRIGRVDCARVVVRQNHHQQQQQQTLANI